MFGSSLLFRIIEGFVLEYSKYMKVHAEGENEEFTIQLLEYFKSKGIHIKNFSRSVENKWYSEDICLMIEIQLNKHQKHRDILNELRLVEGVRLIEEI